MAKSESMFEKIEAEVIKDAGEYVKERVQTKLFKIGEISIFAITGFLLVSFGIAYLMASYFPMLSNGFSFLILGIIFIVTSLSLKM